MTTSSREDAGFRPQSSHHFSPVDNRRRAVQRDRAQGRAAGSGSGIGQGLEHGPVMRHGNRGPAVLPSARAPAESWRSAGPGDTESWIRAAFARHFTAKTHDSTNCAACRTTVGSRRVAVGRHACVTRLVIRSRCGFFTGVRAENPSPGVDNRLSCLCAGDVAPAGATSARPGSSPGPCLEVSGASAAKLANHHHSQDCPGLAVWGRAVAGWTAEGLGQAAVGSDRL
jgi:hypothetical protein